MQESYLGNQNIFFLGTCDMQNNFLENTEQEDCVHAKTQTKLKHQKFNHILLSAENLVRKLALAAINVTTNH